MWWVTLPTTPILHELPNYYINYTLGEDITWLAQLHQHRFINKFRQ